MRARRRSAGRRSSCHDKRNEWRIQTHERRTAEHPGSPLAVVLKNTADHLRTSHLNTSLLPFHPSYLFTMKTEAVIATLVALLAAAPQSFAAPAPDPTAAALSPTAVVLLPRDGTAVVDGNTLTPGVNTIQGNVYTYTDDFVFGPSITQGPNLQIQPGITQAFGCQLVGANIRQGDCDGIEGRISSALASATGGGGDGGAADATPTGNTGTINTGAGDAPAFTQPAASPQQDTAVQSAVETQTADAAEPSSTAPASTESATPQTVSNANAGLAVSPALGFAGLTSAALIGAIVLLA